MALKSGTPTEVHVLPYVQRSVPDDLYLSHRVNISVLFFFLISL